VSLRCGTCPRRSASPWGRGATTSVLLSFDLRPLKLQAFTPPDAHVAALLAHLHSILVSRCRRSMLLNTAASESIPRFVLVRRRRRPHHQPCRAPTRPHPCHGTLAGVTLRVDHELVAQRDDPACPTGPPTPARGTRCPPLAQEASHVTAVRSPPAPRSKRWVGGG
jgi:hypothetical protein